MCGSNEQRTYHKNIKMTKKKTHDKRWQTVQIEMNFMICVSGEYDRAMFFLAFYLEDTCFPKRFYIGVMSPLRF